MKKLVLLAVCHLLSIFMFVNLANAADESFAEQFLASPLLALTAIIVIDIIALIYRKIRK